MNVHKLIYIYKNKRTLRTQTRPPSQSSAGSLAQRLLQRERALLIWPLHDIAITNSVC